MATAKKPIAKSKITKSAKPNSSLISEINFISKILSTENLEKFRKYSKEIISILALCGIVYMYKSNEASYNSDKSELKKEIQELRNMVYEAKEQARKSDSSSASAVSKFEMVQKLKQIPE
jgi:hypothetical protein